MRFVRADRSGARGRDAVWRDRKHVVVNVLNDGRRTHVDAVELAARQAPHKLNDLYLVSHPALRILPA
jgi:hypothetical protein